jgi:anti-sigma28 factor (negative regulator of flagellin synthesis)
MRVPGSAVGTVETRTGETPVRRETTEASSAAPAAQNAVVDGSRSQAVRASSERAEAARSQKLERIQMEIDSGTYKVDLGAVAEKLVDDELSRFGRT